MRSGRFREELYYRINGVHLRLPPLRHRKDDIPALLDFFIQGSCVAFWTAGAANWDPRLSICFSGTHGRGTFANWKISRESSLPLEMSRQRLRT